MKFAKATPLFPILVSMMIIFFIMDTTSFAQDSTRTYKEWVNLGVGSEFFLNCKNRWTNSYGNVGINYNFSIKNIHYFQAGVSTTLTLFGSLCNTRSFYIGSGKRFFNRYLLCAVFLGPSLFTGYKEDNRYTAVGLQSTVQLFFKPLPGLGVGAEFFGYFGFTQNSIGIRFLSIHISNNK